MAFRLDSDLEVVLEENHVAPVVAFQAWVKIGSADEPPELAGMAHMFERGPRRHWRLRPQEALPLAQVQSSLRYPL